jgi:ATP-binding cassette subfamily B multidrug efflux pump
MQTVRTFALFHPTLSLGIGFLLLAHLLLGLPLVEAGELPVGQWVAGLSYVMLLQQPLVEISDRWNFFIVGITGVDRIMEVLSVKPEVKNDLKAEGFKKIEFKNVSFSYSNSKLHAIKNINFKLEAGDWVGVFGPSGSGKSTIIQLIYGFYTPTSGELLWNDRSYQDYHLTSVTQQLGIVEQFPLLFTGTIQENLLMFRDEDIDIEKLLKDFSGFPLIESILGQLDFHVHERGTNLSMGQKQMIAFLRAYLIQPKIWVLDEATAFFDSDAENEVFRALEKRRGEITVFQVAHRPQALSKMNRYFEVRSGGLVESQLKDLPK